MGQNTLTCSSYYSPQQNGIVERENRYLLEVSRSLLFSRNVPKYLWGEAIITAAYLLNYIPARVLQLQTPLNVFLKFFTPTHPFTSLPLKTFDCNAFVYEHKQLRKLEPRDIKTIFSGYSL